MFIFQAEFVLQYINGVLLPNFYPNVLNPRVLVCGCLLLVLLCVSVFLREIRKHKYVTW